MAANRRIPFLLLLIATSVARAEVLEGLFVHSEQGSEFGPCNTGQLLYVTGDEAVLAQLRDSYLRVAVVPHESVYVWLDGKREHAGREVSTDFDASFKVKAVRLLRRRIPEDCILPVDPNADDLDYLYGMIERTPGESGLFGSEPLHGRLLVLLGDQYQVLLDNMSVQGPLVRVGGLLYAEGTGTEPGEAAVFLAAPRLDRLTVILITGGSMEQFAGGDEPIPPPPEVRRFLETVLGEL
jgi:hypothetical protein